MWELLRKKRTGFAFRRQYPISPYVLDFYCPETKVCVEVDGEQHLTRVESDIRRDEYLVGLGIKTIRVPSLELFSEDPSLASLWIRRITELCEQRKAP
jgi:very-short-patch-repair endonuclease